MTQAVLSTNFGFFRRIARGIRSVARRAVPVLGRVARVVAPIAAMIPLPQAQAIGRTANITGQKLEDKDKS
jgi:hypothetical protein